ncbi:MAG: hypothetical protein ACLPTZ_20350 [Beijerinckiaceae bacterium]|jgi:hypothetical protein
MNKIDVRKQLAAIAESTPLARRTPPPAVKVLLPVWGFRYVDQFLNYCLPTLLAPGNIPALAAALPTEFVLLTSSDDESYIRDHTAFRRLAAVCKVEIRLIYHLITDGMLVPKPSAKPAKRCSTLAFFPGV